jgi:hypothetical protein
VWEGGVVLWLMCLFTVGAFFVLAVFLVGRVAEALAAGTGAVTAVAFGLGTHAHPLATISFGHDVAAALAVGGFLSSGSAGRRVDQHSRSRPAAS